jgi:hypothetical protein
MDKRINIQGMLSFNLIQWMTGSYGKEFRLPCGKFEHHKIGGEGYYDALSKNSHIHVSVPKWTCFMGTS